MFRIPDWKNLLWLYCTGFSGLEILPVHSNILSAVIQAELALFCTDCHIRYSITQNVQKKAKFFLNYIVLLFF